MKKLFTVLFAITAFALVANQPAPTENDAVLDEMADTPMAKTTQEDTSINTAARPPKMSYKDARKACMKENKANKKALKDCIKGKRS